MATKKLRISNVTHVSNPPYGFTLDYKGKMFTSSGQPLVIEAEHVPEEIDQWMAKGWVRVVDAESGDMLSPPVEYVQTAGARPDAVTQNDDLDEFDFDPSTAKEARLPANGELQPTAQGAKVSLSLEDQGNAEHSPIPGDKPRSIDNSDQFTVKAPRTQGVGAVIR